MKRRNFLKAAGVAPLAGGGLSFARQRKGAAPQFYEMRTYHLVNFSKQERLHRFLQEAALPAMNRIGLSPVGAFTVKYGPNSPTLRLLLPHPSLESVVTASSRLAADAQYQEEGASFLEAPLSDPLYHRMESELMVAFDQMPALQVPEGAAEGAPRLFELRTYESHSQQKARKKIEMFNEGGEIEIFREVGLTPVFFGETLVGQDLPNLTYMLVFEDLQERNERWEAFFSSPAWKELSQASEYANTVSNITDIILEPTPYSQI